MNLGEIKAAVAARTGTDVGSVFAPIILKAVNDAYREIVGRFNLNPVSVTLPLAAGTQSYDFNTLLTAAVGQADFDGLIELYGTDQGSNPYPLEESSLPHIVKLRSASTTNGQPTNFAVIGSTGLEIWPIPTSGYSLVCWYDRWRTTNELVNDVDIPVLIPVSYHDLLDLRAAVQLASRYESMGQNAPLRDRTIAEYDRRLAEFSQMMRLRQGLQTRRFYTGYRQFARIRPSVPSQDLGGRY